MSNYDVILFDLDGTLTNPELGITSCVSYALNHFGIQVDDLSSLRKFIGPPLIDSFMQYYDFSREQAEEKIRQSVGCNLGSIQSLDENIDWDFSIHGDIEINRKKEEEQEQ